MYFEAITTTIGMTTATNTHGTLDWATIMMEVRAGTNCQFCDFTTPPAFVKATGIDDTTDEG